MRVTAVEWSRRADVVAQAHRIARGIVSVDGALWQECQEPTLVIGSGRGAGGVHQGWVRTYVSPSDPVDPSNTFRLDESDLAERLHEPLARYDITLRMPRLDVLMPELLRVRAGEAALEAAARQLVERMGDDLRTKALPFMAAFVRLRDALPDFSAACDPDGGGADVAGLADLLEATYAEFRSAQGDRASYLSAGGAVRRWREMGADPREVAFMTL